MSTIHLVSHTHWDREWYLTFQHFRIKLVHLIDRLLDILEDDLEYRYFLLDGQAIILEDYLEIRPERQVDLVRLVKSGRLFIGPWYTSPDEFLVSPESHIRNLMEGDRICQAMGGKMLVGYLPDTFGHIGQMPQILRGFGIDTACLWRGLDDQPVELNWESPDGSSVLLSYLRESYSNAANLTTDNAARFIREVEEISQPLLPYTLTSQILLMNGTDHMEPLEDLPQAIRSYQEKYPANNLIHSSLPRYFGSILQQVNEKKLELPVVSGELRTSKRSPLLRDVLSTRITLKQRNSACETALLKWVEPLSAWAHLLDLSHDVQIPRNSNNHYPYVADQNSIIQSAWKLLLQCHPHDSICGTSIDQVADEIKVRFDQVDQICNVLISQNLRRISDHVDTNFPGGLPIDSPTNDILSTIIIFNPNDESQSGVTEVKLRIDNSYSAFEIIDGHGDVYPHIHKGLGPSELLSMSLDKKGFKQGLGMIHEGNIAGMIVQDIAIEPIEEKVRIRVTLSDHGQVNLAKWNQAMGEISAILADSRFTLFDVSAYSDPEIDLSILAKDVPAHGFRCFWVRGIRTELSKPATPGKVNLLFRGLLPMLGQITRIPFIQKLISPKPSRSFTKIPVIENEYLLVDASSPDGTLIITDKVNRQVYTGLNRFVDGGDSGDVYNYSPPQTDKVIIAHKVGQERVEDSTCQKLVIHYVLKLPICLSADRKSRSRKSATHHITSTIMLIPGVPRVDIHTELENQSLDHRLKVHFPAPFSCSSAFYDGHFELVERPIQLPVYDSTWEELPRREAPQRQFTLITNNHSSLAIAVCGLPEVEVLNNRDGNAEIAVTLLRSIGWLSRDDLTTRKGHAGPMGVSTPQAQMLGKHAFDYSIIPGSTEKLISIHQAQAFNAPLKAFNVPLQTGPLPSSLSMLSCSNPGFIISTIKVAKNNSGLIVRGSNITNSPIDVIIKPYKTFQQAQAVDLGEQRISSLPINKNGEVILQVPGNKIITIQFSD